MADYDDTGFDAVESPDADLDAVSGISSTDASKTVAAAKVVEENDPLDSPQAKQSNDVADADQFVRMARWRPFMHLFHGCATSTHLDKNRGERMRVFAREHPLFLRACLLGDYVFVAVCALIVALALAYALARVVGVPLPWA